MAIVVLAAASYLIVRYTPHTTADLTITHIATWQAHTVFKNDTILVGRDKSQDDLYVVTTLRVEDRLKLPLFLKDFTATLTTANGETFESNAVEQPELGPLLTTFPALKPLSTTPLFRDTQIDPGKSAEGVVLLHFPITQDIWDHRESATLITAFYHQPAQTISIK